MSDASLKTFNIAADNFTKKQVSSCLFLGKETGNFWSYLENSSGNKTIESQAVTQPDKAVSLETWVETNRKPVINIGETLSQKNQIKVSNQLTLFLFMQWRRV